MLTLDELQMAMFQYCLGYSRAVRHAGGPVCIAHADMTLT